MLSLLIETCTERSVIAFMQEDEISFMAALPFGIYSSNYAVPKIEEGFTALKKVPQDLKFIAVGIGPGSYTGMRVGATIAKTLSYACKVPLVGVCTLEGFIPDCDCSFAAIIDAKIAGSYILKGKKENGVVSYNSNPAVCRLEDLPAKLNDVSILVSPSYEPLKKRIEALHPDFKKTWQETAPDPLHMTSRARQKFEKGSYSIDGSLELLYLRD